MCKCEGGGSGRYRHMWWCDIAAGFTEERHARDAFQAGPGDKLRGAAELHVQQFKYYIIVRTTGYVYRCCLCKHSGFQPLTNIARKNLEVLHRALAVSRVSIWRYLYLMAVIAHDDISQGLPPSVFALWKWSSTRDNTSLGPRLVLPGHHFT